jgi:hypothetical protein
MQIKNLNKIILLITITTVFILILFFYFKYNNQDLLYGSIDEKMKRPIPQNHSFSYIARFYIDKKRTLHLRGWAVKSNKNTSPKNILVFNDDLKAVVPVNIDRIDVVKKHNLSKELIVNGFDIKIKRVPKGIKKCDLYLIAEFKDNIFESINNNFCK